MWRGRKGCLSPPSALNTHSQEGYPIPRPPYPMMGGSGVRMLQTVECRVVCAGEVVTVAADVTSQSYDSRHSIPAGPPPMHLLTGCGEIY